MPVERRNWYDIDVNRLPEVLRKRWWNVDVNERQWLAAPIALHRGDDGVLQYRFKTHICANGRVEQIGRKVA